MVSTIEIEGQRRTFDVRPSTDPRNAQHPLLPALIERKPEATVPRSYTWSLGGCGILDQGSRGACVGHAETYDAACRPSVCTATQRDAFFTYDYAQTVDEWGDTPPEEGTSINAGAKALRAFGAIDSWKWAESPEALRLGVGYEGPAVLACPWHASMFQVDGQGYVHATGSIAGWHAICVFSVSMRLRRFSFLQSWGRWGIPGAGQPYGVGHMSFATMDTLWSEGAHASLALGRKVIRTPFVVSTETTQPGR